MFEGLNRFIICSSDFSLQPRSPIMPFAKQNLCKHYRKAMFQNIFTKPGTCLRGDKCQFAHSREEQRQARGQYAEAMAVKQHLGAFAREEQVHIENKAAEPQTKCSVRFDVQPPSAPPGLGSVSQAGGSQKMPLQQPVHKENTSLFNCQFTSGIEDQVAAAKNCNRQIWTDMHESDAETDDERFHLEDVMAKSRKSEA